MEFSLNIQVLATVIFAVAVCHTFFTKKFLDWSHHFEKGSLAEASLHLLGEIEVVFGLWAAVFFIILSFLVGPDIVLKYHESLHYIEPIFVFCIMVMAATRPVLYACEKFIEFKSRWLTKLTKQDPTLVNVFVVLFVGPLMGSFITEPAAMTVTALLLFSMIKNSPAKLMYSILAVLFVNVSVGGAMTPYAAPPILMVAGKWSWDFSTVFSLLGWKAILICFINSFGLVYFMRKQIKESCRTLEMKADTPVPATIVIVHMLLIAILVLVGHHQNSTMGVFLLFLGVSLVTKKYQSPLRLKEGLLVAFFLGGIMVFGPFQKWWLVPVLSTIGDLTMFVTATALTAITDNAALTFLGSQVESLSESSKYFLVAGALAGGGLTVIANAPNAAGYSLLQSKFPQGLNPLQLLISAVPPTLVAFVILGFC